MANPFFSPFVLVPLATTLCLNSKAEYQDLGASGHQAKACAGSGLVLFYFFCVICLPFVLHRLTFCSFTLPYSLIIPS